MTFLHKFILIQEQRLLFEPDSLPGFLSADLLRRLAGMTRYLLAHFDGCAHESSYAYLNQFSLGPVNFDRVENVSHFQLQNQAIEMASVRLHELVKLTIFPPIPNCCGGTGGSVFGNTDEPKLDFQFEDENVAHILDVLAVASNRTIWIVTFSGTPVLTPTGFRKTATLWNNSPIPEDEQPV